MISKYKPPSLDCNFLARYLLHVKNGVTLQIQLHKILITEFGCNLNDSTIGRALAVATSKLLFNEDKGYNLMQSYCDRMNLNGGYAHLDTVEVKQDGSLFQMKIFHSNFSFHLQLYRVASTKTSSSICKVCMFRCMSFVWTVQRDVNLCYKSRFQWNDIYSCPWFGS